MDDPQTKLSNIAIVGGGLGGVVLAIGLLRQGLPVHIYEAAQGFGEIGAGVTFGPNAIRAIGLVSPEILAAYKMHATFNANYLDSFSIIRCGIRSRQDAKHGNEDADDLVFHVRSDEQAMKGMGVPARCCVHRAHFLNEIVKLIPPDRVSFNKALVTIEDDDSGARLHFADGSSAAHSAVIGCDGIKSVVRQHLHGPEALPIFAEEYAYRALVPAEAFEELMGHDRTANGQLYVGRGNYCVSYPIEHGRSINMVAMRNRPGSVWTHDSWIVPSTHEEVLADFDGWNPNLIELLARYGTRDKWALFHLPHDREYFRGRVCLLGDSAHATTPHMGAGAGQAMEDAYVLSELLGAARSPDDLTTAFAAYDAVRRPRTQQLVQWSFLMGLTYTALEEGVGEDAEKMEAIMMKRFRWLWNEDLVLHAEQAKAMMMGS